MTGAVISEASDSHLVPPFEGNGIGICSLGDILMELRFEDSYERYPGEELSKDSYDFKIAGVMHRSHGHILVHSSYDSVIYQMDPVMILRQHCLEPHGIHSSYDILSRSLQEQRESGFI